MSQPPSSQPSLRARLAKGFTLVEVLVVMALLSMVMLAMGSALRTVAQTEDRINARLLRADEIRVANEFLRSVLGRVVAQKTLKPVAAGENPFVFAGAAQELTWIGIMPARFGVGGRYLFQLGIERRNDGGALVLRFLPWSASDANIDWAQSQTHVLVRGVAAFNLQYQDARAALSGTWFAQWAAPDGLPERVLINLVTDAGAWPELVIAMRVLPAVDDPLSSGQLTVGGQP